MMAPSKNGHRGMQNGAPDCEGPTGTSQPSKPPRERSRRMQRFDSVLQAAEIDVRTLSDLAWSGVPAGFSRSEVWQLLLYYLPLDRDRSIEVLASKREEYRALRQRLYDCSEVVRRSLAGEAQPEKLSEEDLLLRQIRKDLPRTQARFDDNTDLPVAELVVKSPQLQGTMERVLFLWALQGPASGYVQGIDGILLLLLLIFLADNDGSSICQLEPAILERLGEERLNDIEADSYFCLTKILALMIDHHADGFPGIQRMTRRLVELVWRIDEKLAKHLDDQGVDLLEPGVRWIGCLMVRELPVSACARLWDALIAEASLGPGDEAGESFETMLLYFCVCYLTRSSVRIMEMDFEAITMFLKRGPSEPFGEDAVELLLSEAFVLKSLFQSAQSHLRKIDTLKR